MSQNELKENLANIVSRLRKGNIPEATKVIPQIIGGLKTFGNTQDNPHLKDLAIAVRGVVDSFQKKDYVLMADLIEYEILPLLE